MGGTTVHVQYQLHFPPNSSDWGLGDSMDPEQAEVIKISTVKFPIRGGRKPRPKSTFLKQSARVREPAKYHGDTLSDHD